MRLCAWQVFYRSNPAREAFVEMCESEYVQRMTFDSYLYKTVVPGVHSFLLNTLNTCLRTHCTPVHMPYTLGAHSSCGKLSCDA